MTAVRRRYDFDATVVGLRSLLGGAVGAIACLAIVLTLGVLALAPLGDRAAPVGVPAAFACVIVSASVYALFSQSSSAAGGPSSPTALIVSLLFIQVLQQESSDGRAVALPAVLALLGAAAMAMGLLQMLMAALHLGRLARFVPQPVLAGFMNGIAVLVALAQVPALLAVAPELWAQQAWQALQQAQAGALALGLATAGLVWLLAWRSPRLPAALAAVVLATLGYHLAQATWPSLDLGPGLGAFDTRQFWPGLLALWAEPEATLALVVKHARPLGLTAVLLALVGSLESLLNLRAADQHSGEQSDESRELWALGLANLGGGLFGALPMTRSRSRATAIHMGGGRGRVGAMGAALCSALLVGLGGACLVYLPNAVLAGVMLTVAVNLVDRRSIRQLSQRLQGHPVSHEGLLTMGLVCLLTLLQGPGAGVALGLLLSMLLFLRGLNRSLLRARFSAQQRPSRRVYPPQAEQLLQTARAHIHVLELEGALFFGNADRVHHEAKRLPAGARYLIVDLQRVMTIDESGALALQQLDAQLARQHRTLLLAGVGPTSAQRRQLLACWAGSAGDASLAHGYADLDHALEAAEMALLQAGTSQHRQLGDAVPLGACSLLRDLSVQQQEALRPYLQQRRLLAGEWLFKQGDAGDCVFMLTRGSISIVDSNGQRFISFSAGTMLGELAMLDGQGRSANAMVDQDAEVFLLSTEGLNSLAATDPVLCSRLYRNMALHLAERLRVASRAW